MSRFGNCCRLCGGYAPHYEMHKYSVRHYAHFRCYLEAGRPIDSLQAWELGRFPFRLLQELGLYEKAQEVYRRKRKEEKAREVANGLAARAMAAWVARGGVQ